MGSLRRPSAQASPTSRGDGGPLAAGLGDSHRRILDRLKRRGESDLAALEADLGLGRETLRGHLGTLAAMGLVERSGVRREGPGRPSALYRLTAAAEDLYPRREGEILRELVEHLTAAGQERLLEEFFARRSNAKLETYRARVADLQGLDRLRAVAEILSEQGFLAEVETSDAGRLRLCHCPLRDLVAASRVPCRFEMSLVEELLGEPLRRDSFMPSGDATCTYSKTPAAPHERLVSLPTT